MRVKPTSHLPPCRYPDPVQTRLLLRIAAWQRHRWERRIAHLERTNPMRAKFERLREDVRRLEVERRLLRARLRRVADEQSQSSPPDDD